MKIVFLGDSITDCGKNIERGSLVPVGQSYVMLVSSRLGRDEPMQHTFINSGISGDRCVDVLARIKKDCWNLEPDVISIFLGVNDVGHELYEHNGVSAERYEAVMRMILSDTKKALPNVKFILMAPFVFCGSLSEAYFDEFREGVKERAAIVEKLAKELNAPFISVQKLFDDACKEAPSSYWSGDGVHATPAGHQLLADAWMEAFNTLR